jgi:hypothetical protein
MHGRCLLDVSRNEPLKSTCLEPFLTEGHNIVAIDLVDFLELHIGIHGASLLKHNALVGHELLVGWGFEEVFEPLLDPLYMRMNLIPILLNIK